MPWSGHLKGGGIMATPEIALIALVLAGFAMAPAESPAPAPAADPGKRVESDSFTAPPELARCIAHNISRKMPHLSVRQRSDATADDRILLVLSAPGAETFGVIRVAADQGGSKLTTWLAASELPAAPEVVAKRLVAGC